jgi:hypothetical protein
MSLLGLDQGFIAPCHDAINDGFTLGFSKKQHERRIRELKFSASILAP